MEVNVKSKGEEYVLELFEKAKNLEPGTKEYEAVMTAIEKLLRQLNEDDKLNLEVGVQYDKLQQEKQLAEQKAKQEKKTKIIEYVIEGGKIVVSVITLGCYGKWLKDGYTFEKEGIITSSWMRNLINKIHPTKK